MENVHDRVREVLLREWDPHEVMKRVEVYGDSARFRYDGYVGALVELVRGGGVAGSEEGVMDYLAEREAESMCFPGLGRERLRRVARGVRRAVLGEGVEGGGGVGGG